MNNPTMSLVEPMTSLLEGQTFIGDMLPAPDVAQLAPIAPFSMNNFKIVPEIVQQFAQATQANIINGNLSTLGLPGLIPLNAGTIGLNNINAGTTASSNIIDMGIIAGTGLFPPITSSLPLNNTTSSVPTQTNIMNGIFPSTNLPGIAYNTVVPQSNIVSGGTVPIMNLPGLVPISQPNNAMNQNFLNSGMNVANAGNIGFMNAFNTGGFGGGISVSEPYAVFSLIGAVALFIVIRRGKNIFSHI